MTKSVDEIIREAIEQGKFNNLPNQGKKLDLSNYFDTPEDLRIGYSVLKSGDYVPEEVLILKEIGELKEQLGITHDEAQKKKLLKAIQQKQLAYNLLIERFKRHSKI